jgi:flavin reductase (DIM6/NTAB) family NADH-FMN oxidoreductase RutF
MDTRSFALAQETMRSGLYVVSSAHRRTLAGCTCVWVSRAAFAPALMSVCLAPTRHTFEVLKAGGRFCINVLGEGDLDLARTFGFNTGHEVDKFADVAWHKGKGGSPVLDTAVSFLDCKLEQILEAGDHRIVLGEVIDADVQTTERPAVYVAESFYAGAPAPLIAEGGGAL